MNIQYRIATHSDFNALWDRNIAENPEEPMWPIWRERFQSRICQGLAVTFAVVIDGEPVGEGTLELNTGKDPRLCDGKHNAYLAALRIRPEWEGQGHISRLVHLMEQYARERGFTQLTIGVEAAEERNLAIYRHWGFDHLLLQEDEDGETVLYFAKTLCS